MEATQVPPPVKSPQELADAKATQAAIDKATASIMEITGHAEPGATCAKYGEHLPYGDAKACARCGRPAAEPVGAVA